MNWKSAAVIFGGLLTLIFIACAIYFISVRSESRYDIEDLSMKGAENSSVAGIEKSIVIDVPCRDGTRYDATTNSCRRKV